MFTKVVFIGTNNCAKDFVDGVHIFTLKPFRDGTWHAANYHVLLKRIGELAFEIVVQGDVFARVCNLLF